MFKTKQIQPLEEFSSPDQGWGSWIVGTLVSFTIGSKPKLNGKFVLLESVKIETQKILNKLSTQDNHIMFMEDLRKHILTDVNGEDIEIILAYLEKTKRASFIQLPGSNIRQGVKFSSTNCDITDADRGVVHLKLTLQKLQTQKNELELKISDCTTQAKRSVKQKEQALIYLRNKKRLSTILTKRISCIDTIVQILEKIEDTQTNKEMLDAFKIGTHTLNQTTKKVWTYS